MFPPRPSALAATGDNSWPSKKLVRVAAKPMRIMTIAPRRCDSMTRINTTASTSVSPTVRATGNPFAANGAATKTAQRSRINRTVRLGSLTRSCQVRNAARLLPATTEPRLLRPAGMPALAPAFRIRLEDLWDQPERIVGFLVVAATLPLRQFDLRLLHVLVGDFAQNVGEGIQPCPPLVVGVDDIPRCP